MMTLSMYHQATFPVVTFVVLFAQMTVKDEDDIIKDLRRRIAAIPCKQRPIPKTKDKAVLAFELKCRLAMKSPVIVENIPASRRKKVIVKEEWPRSRRVSFLYIDSEQDCEVLTTTKVAVRAEKV